MKVTEIRELSVPLHGAVQNSLVSFANHSVSLVAIVTDVVRNGRPLIGLAFNSIGRHAQSGILRNRMIPRVLGEDPDSLLCPDEGVLSPSRVLAAAMRDEKPGGHGDRASAAAALELACWDLVAKYRDEPAWATIARLTGSTPLAGGAPVYAAGGYYQADDSTDRLAREVQGYLDQGYRQVKIKIGGAPLRIDLGRIEAALQVLGSGQALAVDANGRFDRSQALAYGKELAQFDLAWYEEPGDPLDFDLNRLLAQEYPGAIATGENLFSVPDVRNLLLYGGLRPGVDRLQMDAGLSYGLTEYIEMLELMADHGINRDQALPHGGHLINLHIVVGLGLGGCESYPGVFQPFGGFGPLAPIVDGRVLPPEAPGFGLETKPELGVEIGALVDHVHKGVG